VDPRKRLVTELNRRIAENTVEASSQLERLGDYLAGQDEKAFSDPEFLAVRRNVLELRAQLPASRRQVRSIMQCVEKNAELEAGLRGAGQRFEELQRENETICEEIGRFSYEAFRSQSLPLEGLAELFVKVGRQEQELASLSQDQERSRGSMRSGNILRMIGGAGRGFFLRSAVGFKRKAVARAYAEAGRGVCESPLAESEPTLKRRLEPYRQNRARQEELAREAEALREEQSKLRGELRELGADKSHQRRVRELERGIQRAEEELAQTSRQLGELYRAKPVRSLGTDPEVKNRLRRAAQAEKASEKYRKRIRRLEAAMQIDALDAQVRAMREKIEKVTREIRAREQEVRELEERIAASEGERERLVKVRGPEQDLLELEEPEGDSE
jgi:DNA repair exonuclease SbcCD ATPase subunit